MRGKWLLFSGVVILAAIAAGALSVLRKGGKAEVKKAPAPAAAPVFAGEEISLTGRVSAQHVVKVAAPLSGVLDMVLVEPGQDVHEGQLLVHIKNQTLDATQEHATAEAERAQARVVNLDGAILAARLEAARADADSSRAQAEAARLQKIFDRQQLLIREGATPRLVFEKAQREYDTAKAEADTAKEVAANAADRASKLQKDLDLAKKTLEDRNSELEDAKADVDAADVHSPVDGLLIGVRGQAGAEVDDSMQDLFQIAVDLGLLQVVVEPPPPALARCRAGQDALVSAAELGGEALPGKVIEVRGNEVVVQFNSPDPALKPGMTVHVKIKFGP